MTKTNSTVRYTSFFGQGKYVHRRGFTLIELLIVMAIIGCIASALALSLNKIQLSAKKKRCEQQIRLLHEIVIRHWEEVVNHPLPLPDNVIVPNENASESVVMNFREQLMLARREFVRREIPDRRSDIAPLFLQNQIRLIRPDSGRTENYINLISPGWTKSYQGSECLYMILSTLQDNDTNALDFLLPSEIGDLDDDGMPEIIDPFGTPIGFLRWAPYYGWQPGLDGKWGIAGQDDDENNITDDPSEFVAPGSDDYLIPGIQAQDAQQSPDWTDLGMADFRYYTSSPLDEKRLFNLFPLIVSAGPDGIFDCHGLPDTTEQLNDLLEDPYAGERRRLNSNDLIDEWRGNNSSLGNKFPHNPYAPTNFGMSLGNQSVDNIVNHNIGEAN